ncbi:hypothetical protein TNCV_2404701 [Trichonephila clavipes]|nr:hypothetical protein TNCV_2404701 [Trichonephila clavipes]
MFDLKTIFERLLHFKLKANREKCHFASSRVKYLEFWITQKGIEVDPEKVTSTSQNKHVPSPSTATAAVSNRTIHPSTRATTTTANYVSSLGRRRIHRGRL